MIDISVCNNKYCIAYKFNKCRRAKAHKDAISKREQFVSYIPTRNCTDICDLHLPTGEKQ
jgi:hypothetical protein